MKKLVYVLVFLLCLQLVSAICDDSDSGKNYYNFGWVEDDGIVRFDYCVDDEQLNEYVCDSTTGNYDNVLTTCDQGCVGGKCLSETCPEYPGCVPGLEFWCDESGNWQSSDYCGECSDYDASCSNSCETEGACDYNAQKYCLNGEWEDTYYCDVANCGDDEHSQDACFCSSDESEESSCSDGKDDDCDGSIDCNDSDCAGASGCACTEGVTQDCGNSAGVCGEGVQYCVGGSWGECLDEESGEDVVVASEEVCDDLDNDCDGEVDEDCTCIPGDTRDCGSDVGVCEAGVQTCDDDGGWSICFGASYAASEIEECNGIDDDCDGSVDEGCGCVEGYTQECGSDEGACEKGVQSCEAGEWGECEGEVEAFPEVCGDLIDNDCDGDVDYSDDTCAAPEEESETVSEEESEVDVECESDNDCAIGEECSRNTCIETSEVDVDEEVDSSEEDEEEDTSSTPLSNYDTDEDKSVSFVFIAIPIILVVLLLVVGSVFYLQNKGKLTIGKNPFKKKGASPVSKRPMKVNIPGKAPGPRQEIHAVHTRQPKSQVKSFLDKKLDESFEKSKELFGKK